jgi:hypothetical protein
MNEVEAAQILVRFVRSMLIANLRGLFNTQQRGAAASTTHPHHHHHHQREVQMDRLQAVKVLQKMFRAKHAWRFRKYLCRIMYRNRLEWSPKIYPPPPRTPEARLAATPLLKPLTPAAQEPKREEASRNNVNMPPPPRRRMSVVEMNELISSGNGNYVHSLFRRPSIYVQNSAAIAGDVGRGIIEGGTHGLIAIAKGAATGALQGTVNGVKSAYAFYRSIVDIEAFLAEQEQLEQAELVAKKRVANKRAQAKKRGEEAKRKRSNPW